MNYFHFSDNYYIFKQLTEINSYYNLFVDRRLLVILTPKKQMGKLMKKIANVNSQLFIKIFIKCFKIDLSTAEKKEISEYKCIQDVFTRQVDLSSRDKNWIKNDKYKLQNCQSSIVSPADSIFTQYGIIQNQEASNYEIKVKNTTVKIQDFLGEQHIQLKNDKKLAYFIFYLSPKYYHHFHSSFNFQAEKAQFIDGQLYPVNSQWSQQAILNTRIIISGQSEINNIKRQTYYIPVAALNVSDMQLTKGQQIMKPQIIDYKYDFKQGDEIGTFKFGSTVVIIIELEQNESIQLLKEQGQFNLVGTQVANIIQNDNQQ